MLTISDLCKKYKITRQTLYNWRKEGMPCMKLSQNIVVFDEKAVGSWVQENKARYKEETK